MDRSSSRLALSAAAVIAVISCAFSDLSAAIWAAIWVVNLSDLTFASFGGLVLSVNFASSALTSATTFSISSSATSSVCSSAASSSPSSSSVAAWTGAFLPLVGGGDANLYAAALYTSACASTLASNGREYPPPIVITSGTSRLRHSSKTMWLRRSIPARVILSLPNESTASASTPAWKYTSRGSYVSKSRGSHSSSMAMYSLSPVPVKKNHVSLIAHTKIKINEPSGTSTSWSDRIFVFHG